MAHKHRSKKHKKKRRHHHRHHVQIDVSSDEENHVRPRPVPHIHAYAIAILVFVMAVIIAIAATVTTLLKNNHISTSPPSTFQSTILNQPHQKLDTNGEFINIHDGNVIRHPPSGTYYMVGVAYGDCHEYPGTGLTVAQGGDGGFNQVFSGCLFPGGTLHQTCGNWYNHTIVMYSSKDLEHWTPIHGGSNPVIFNMVYDYVQANVVAYTAKGLWNPNTHEIVLWLFLNDEFGVGIYAVITAQYPFTSWTMRDANVQSLNCSQYTDDVALVQMPAPPYTAWFSYTCHAELGGNDGHFVFIEEMTPDYYATLGPVRNSGSVPLDTYTEAQAIFYYNGLYCYSRGVCSCYGYNDTLNYISCGHSPVGPFTVTQKIPFTAAIPNQQSSIFPYYDADGNRQLMWWGDQWQSAPPPFLKSMDFNYWSPLLFDSNNNIIPLQNQDRIAISVGPGPADGI